MSHPPAFIHLRPWPPPEFSVVFLASFHLDTGHASLSCLSQLASWVLSPSSACFHSLSNLLPFLGQHWPGWVREDRGHRLYCQVFSWSIQTPLSSEEHAEQIYGNVAQLSIFIKTKFWWYFLRLPSSLIPKDIQDVLYKEDNVFCSLGLLEKLSLLVLNNRIPVHAAHLWMRISPASAQH